MTQSQTTTHQGFSDTETKTAPLRFLTAASIFDGHDAAINIMRRVLQDQGTEVIHLGHNRSAQDIVEAAIQEDVHGIAISSYQGGHVEFFRYVVELLREQGLENHIRVFGGGGGTITDEEIAELEGAGVCKIYSVEDGRLLGLEGMIRDMLQRATRPATAVTENLSEAFLHRRPGAVSSVLSQIEHLHSLGSDAMAPLRQELRKLADDRAITPLVLGLTGTGGAGKSSLVDELVRRFLDTFPDRTFAVLSVDPSRRRTGGALLGDRIRMNALGGPRTFMRSLATRQAHLALSGSVADSLLALQAANYDLIILETAGIGQADSEVVDLADHSLYVMTPEFGAPTQLEKIDMLDFADSVAINKAEKRGAEDALRDVRKQVMRNRKDFERDPAEAPVWLTSANRFSDPGVDRLFAALCTQLELQQKRNWATVPAAAGDRPLPTIVPAERAHYLAEIADAVSGHRHRAESQAELASRADGLARALHELGDPVPSIQEDYASEELLAGAEPAVLLLRQRYHEVISELTPAIRQQLQSWPALRANYEQEEFSYTVRNHEIRVPTTSESLSGLQIPKVATPRTQDWGELTRFFELENLPGHFPFTSGVFPFKRTAEDPTRMFAGEGLPERTNRRFHYVSQGQPAVRLSTAFDSVTLYGQDPAQRPDIEGKIGNAGVSICSLDDAKRLYSGFDLSAPNSSVSMTINGPAPIVLAFFLNTAIDQEVEKRLRATGRWEEAEKTIAKLRGKNHPGYRAHLPEGHDGSGLGLLGVSGSDLLPPEEYKEIRETCLQQVRGTVQADILKEDQAQNTCIFSTEFALRMMGDVQEWFLENKVRNFYSVSISGYHIAEAGANPITQLAFTLANGFTYVEYYRARGMDVNDFAPNLSFFFSNGTDAEYSVLGRVARRIWAIAMRDRFRTSERAQQLKYHIQTSGRSLHAQEIQFNDIRTTLQALSAILDNCQSLHTNAFDEAITTPTEESVRRALAIQLIINRELGLAKNENPLQGAFITEHLTELVEDAVLQEFRRISDRGGVLGAMETMYQRSRIQEESLLFEMKKHSGELPIVGVNTFQDPNSKMGATAKTELIRSTPEERNQQIEQVQALHRHHRAHSEAALLRLQEVALQNGNIFGELMETVKLCSLGQITEALYQVGGEYRRSM